MKKKRLGAQLEKLNGGVSGIKANVSATPDSDWVSVERAPEIFYEEAREFFAQYFDENAISADVVKSGNVDLKCGEGVSIYFRVQALGVVWARDTLVIANVRQLRSLQGGDPFDELLVFIMCAHKRVGYLKLGIEYPGKLEMAWIERFGFTKLKDNKEYWIISVNKLQNCISSMKSP